MSKIVYLGVPAHGHVNPVLPVVRELVRRGEQVLFYNTDEFRSRARDVGAAFRAYTDSPMTSAAISAAVHDGNLARMSALILRTAEQLIPYTLAELARERPDLVIFDAVALWGRMAATMLSLPTVATIPFFVVDRLEDVLDRRSAVLQTMRLLPMVPTIFLSRSRLVRRYGSATFPPMSPLFPLRGDLNIIFTSRAIHPDSRIFDETFRFVRPSIDPRSRHDALPDGALGKHPLVYISFGTVHSRHVDLYRSCLDELASYPARFVLAVGAATDVGTLGPIPENFLVRKSVPQLEVLSHADAFVSHGGMNSIHEALYYGVPLVLVPQQLEQLFGARAVAERGAGLVVEDQIVRGRVAVSTLRAAVASLLTEMRYREAAMKLRDALRATGGYREVADEIQTRLRASRA